MSLPRLFLLSTLVLFLGIGFAAWAKKRKTAPPIAVEAVVVKPAPVAVVPKVVAKKEAPLPRDENLPEVNRIAQLFAFDSSKLPFVETISYTSRVPWLKDRPAWIADYASHFETSRHFIARSLNRKADYFTQKVAPGDRFNVFKRNAQVQFHLLIDLKRCKMWFYALDAEAGERTLLKTYRVGLGRAEGSRSSGSLTPMGKYSLGEKVAIYKPGTMGTFQDKKTEMIRIFGTRWIPFDRELEGCSDPAKGFGIHGAPWIADTSGQLIEDRSQIGKYSSDGCIRMTAEDMEELFAIIITKPTVVEIVRDFAEARLPGAERK